MNNIIPKRLTKCNEKLDINYVKEYAKSLGYACLSKNYINNFSKLRFICPNGHKYSTSWMIFSRDESSCQICRRTYTGIDGNKNRIYRDRNWLYNKYINKRMSSKEIGQLCNVGHRVVLAWLHKFCISVRDTSLSTTLGQYKKHDVLYKKVNDDEKVCLRCEKIKKKSEFRKASASKDGLQVYCNKCQDSFIPKENGWRKYTSKELNRVNLYRDRVKRLTNENYRKYFNIINPFKLNRSSGKYSLDHIYSVQDGFDNNVSIEIISSPVNLRMITINENSIKGKKSYITLDELFELHNRFMEEVNE